MGRGAGEGDPGRISEVEETSVWLMIEEVMPTAVSGLVVSQGSGCERLGSRHTGSTHEESSGVT